MGRPKSKGYVEPEFVFEHVLYQDDKSQIFSIGPSDEEVGADLLVCKKCGTNEFYVGRSTVFTAVKCPNCGFEVCIHEG